MSRNPDGEMGQLAAGKLNEPGWRQEAALALINAEFDRACLRRGEVAQVVNVTGPLGVGKSALLITWAAGSHGVPAAAGAGRHAVPLVDLAARDGVPALGQVLRGTGARAAAVDSADGPAAGDLARLLAAPAGVSAPVVVVASRRPLLSLPGWPGPGRVHLARVHVGPWPDAQIAGLAGEIGTPPADRDTVVRLSGGIPLIAEYLGRALRGEPPPGIPAAADRAVRAIAARLRRELEPGAGTDPLSLMASVGASDEELLSQLTGVPAAELFTALGALSIVQPGPLGLSVVEPFRTLLDLACRWRRPVTHRTALTTASAHRRRLLAVARDPVIRASLVSQALFLTDDGLIRDNLFPGAVPPVRLRPLAPGDERLAGQLLHTWAKQRGLNCTNLGKVLEDWLVAAADGFRIAVAADTRPVGMINVVRVSEQTIPTLEPLLQHHTGQLIPPRAECPGEDMGVFAGFYICADGQPAARAALLHHVLGEAMGNGRLALATPWPDIEALVRQLGFAHHGETGHDIYACGRQAQVFTHSFTAAALTSWLDRLSALGIPAPVPAGDQHVIGLIRHALNHLDTPAALAGNPLLALPGITSAEALRERLIESINTLAASGLPARADAGQVLLHYYLKRRGGHEVTAHRLHLSRATYFRRLNHGLGALAEQLLHQPPSSPAGG
jgi:hypothetical protein